jgi:transposase
VKNDFRDSCDLVDLLRMGRLPKAWIAPPATRELRELVRHRAKLVSMRSRCKAQVHAVLARCGVAVPMSDLFGVAGTELLDKLELPAAYAARVASLHRIMDLLDFEIDVAAGLVTGRLSRDPGYTAVQTIPGIGRFPTPEKLTCWAGMTPEHRESDTTVHRGKITKQGSRLVRWAAVESVQRLPGHTRLGAFGDAVAAKRGHTIAAARRRPPPTGVRLLRPTRPPRTRRPAHTGSRAGHHNGHPAEVGLVTP